MTAIDIIIVVIFAIGAINGFIKGFLKQLASLLGFIVGLLAAKALYVALAAHLHHSLGGSMTVAQIVAFIMIWIIVPLLFAIVASLLTKMMEALSIGWLNRFLGAGLGGLKALVLIGLLVGVVEYIDVHNTWIEKASKQESVLYYPMKDLGEIFVPVAKEVAEGIVAENL